LRSVLPSHSVGGSTWQPRADAGARRQPGTGAFRELSDNPDDETFPGIAYCASTAFSSSPPAEALDDRVRALIRDGEPRLHALVLDLEGVDFIDSQAQQKLAELNEVGPSRRVHAPPGRVKPQVLAVLDADGLAATLGADRVTATWIKLSRRSSPRTPDMASLPCLTPNRVEQRPSCNHPRPSGRAVQLISHECANRRCAIRVPSERWPWANAGSIRNKHARAAGRTSAIANST